MTSTGDTTPMAPEAALQLFQVGMDGLAAYITPDGKDESRVLIGLAVMDVDRDQFRWLIDSASAYHGVNVSDQTGTGTRGWAYRDMRTLILNTMVETVRHIDVDSAKADDPMVLQLTRLVLDSLSLPDDPDA